METITVFNHILFGTVPVLVDESGTPWFVGTAIAELLGYTNPSMALKEHVDKDDSKVLIYKAYNKSLEAKFIWSRAKDYSNKIMINEYGVYDLVWKSKLPQARAFKRWVIEEVLPQIAQTGGYIPRKDANGRLYSEEEMRAIAQEVAENTLKIHVKELEQMKKQLAEQAPKVNFANAIEISDDTFYIGEVAQMITQHGYHMGRTRLFYYLRKHGYMYLNNRQPKQKWVEKGYLRVCVRTYCDACGRRRVNVCTKITTLGAEYFINLFTKDKLAA